MFKGTSLQKFSQLFQSETVCRQYLFDLKWKRGFACRRCAHKKRCKGQTSFHARCSNCNYDESATAHTLFHKIQIPLSKAFAIVFQIAVFKKGISSLEISKVFEIDENTALRFRKRVQAAMAAWISKEARTIDNEKHTKLDGIVLINRAKDLSGLQRVGVVLERYRRSLPEPDLLRCRSIVLVSDELENCSLVAGHYVDIGKEILLWNLKAWLTGTHHHCSEKYIDNYNSEFFFRFNNRHRQDQIWHLLIGVMVQLKPYYCT